MKSDAPHPPSPPSLLVHDGELGDVRALLDGLGTGYLERCGAPEAGDREAGWDLVIGTPKRLLALSLEESECRPTRIAICDQDSRTLRNSLRRSGIALMVLRPVHPMALRALILHALYRGPEKRRSRRVSVGAPVRYRMGWRQRPAILADLSLGGFRLLAQHEAERGRGLTLHVPAEVAAGRAFSVRARVLGSSPAEGQPEGSFLTSAKFERLSASSSQRIQATVQAHGSGPARLASAEAVSAQAPAEAPPAGGGASDSPAAREERRLEPRLDVEARAVALDEEASRVLMGRDISVGGMRVDANPRLVVGENFDLAIHAAPGEGAIRVRARVHRDDGERGVVLRFHELSPDAARALNRMLDALPLVEPDAKGDAGCIVSEIFEARAG